MPVYFWMPSEGTVFGYALTLQRLKRQRPFLETVNRYDGLFPKAVDLLFQDATAGSPLPCDPAPPVAAAAPAGGCATCFGSIACTQAT